MSRCTLTIEIVGESLTSIKFYGRIVAKRIADAAYLNDLVHVCGTAHTYCTMKIDAPVEARIAELRAEADRLERELVGKKEATT